MFLWVNGTAFYVESSTATQAVVYVGSIRAVWRASGQNYSPALVVPDLLVPLGLSTAMWHALLA